MTGVSLRILTWVFRWLPRRLALGTAQLLGWIWFYLVRTRKTLCIDQLQRAFPEWTPREIRQCTRRLFAHLCRSGVEFLTLDKVLRDPHRAITVSGREHYEAAKSQGKGVLVLTAHLGNWELLLSWATSFTDLAVVSKTPTEDQLGEYLMRQRERYGVHVFPTENSLFQILDYLRDGGSVGFVIDQHYPGKRGVYVPFFNRWAATTTGLATLAKKSGAPVLPVFVTRGADGHHVRFAKALPYERRDSLSEELAVNTIRYSLVVEAAIRQTPEQWLWLHRRWKEEPDLPVDDHGFIRRRKLATGS